MKKIKKYCVSYRWYLAPVPGIEPELKSIESDPCTVLSASESDAIGIVIDTYIDTIKDNCGDNIERAAVIDGEIFTFDYDGNVIDVYRNFKAEQLPD